MSTQDGGPAFPGPDDYAADGRPLYGPKRLFGMTLRDYFAASAMQAYVTAEAADIVLDVDITAADAYKMADAMLRAREGK